MREVQENDEKDVADPDYVFEVEVDGVLRGNQLTACRDRLVRN